MHAFERSYAQAHLRPVTKGTGPDWPRLLHMLQRKLGVRQKDLVPVLRVDQSTVNRWFSGKIVPTKPEHIAAIMAALRREKISFDLYQTDSHIIAIIGHVHGTAEVELISNKNASIIPPQQLGVAPMVDNSTAETVALVVEGGAMAPMFDAGWILYYDDNRTPPSQALIGQLCVVRTRDGRTLVRKLIESLKPGLWSLLTPGGQLERDQEVEWAEQIFNVAMPRRH